VADPTNIYKHFPDVYDRNSGSDQYKWLSAVAEATVGINDAAQDFLDDLSISSADGAGLNRLGETFDAPRPPGMSDARDSALVSAFVGARRCTVAAIAAVFEAATGITDATVEDKQLNAAIPSYEIWITPGAAGFSQAYGRGFYPEFPTNKDGYPVESSLAGVIINEEGFYGGLFNDHTWDPVDYWTKLYLDKVRPAGTKIIFKG